MAHMTEDQRRKHARALQLLEKDALTIGERWEVLENFQEQADYHDGAAGAWFTPPALAKELAIEATGPSVIDLCAGIGTLAFMAARMNEWEPDRPRRIVCIEKNPKYVEIGRKIVPEAEWICGDVFEEALTLGRFACAIANPPYGPRRMSWAARSCHGRRSEWKIVHLASLIAGHGVFLMPQQSAGFTLSHPGPYTEHRSAELREWMKATGLTLGHSCGIDISGHADAWNPGKPPPLEIVCCDFEEQRAEAANAAKAQPDLFPSAA